MFVVTYARGVLLGTTGQRLDPVEARQLLRSWMMTCVLERRYQLCQAALCLVSLSPPLASPLNGTSSAPDLDLHSDLECFLALRKLHQPTLRNAGSCQSILCISTCVLFLSLLDAKRRAPDPIRVPSTLPHTPRPSLQVPNASPTPTTSLSVSRSPAPSDVRPIGAYR